MTVVRLLGIDSPADAADWYAAGRAYTRRVAAGMGFDGVDAVDGTAVTATLRSDPAALSRREAASVVGVLVGDAVFTEPFCAWMPAWYDLGLRPAAHVLRRRLRAIAREVARATDLTVTLPRFSRPRDVFVEGRSPLARVTGFRERFVLAAAVTHLEWFAHAADADGITVPRVFLSRARAETLAHYAGSRRTLSTRVRRFQRLLFSDDAWVRDVDEAYGLNSWLFGRWARWLGAERVRLAATADG
ncbi:hypothetical protein [Haloplanus pelagicus]|uniref:hypothetical protein n=1 Tax=Haloplanus pelagicus TaxID=2949995 RepID=UPI00203DDFF7|nr:hypothetical protein [Haloplanus sp. HW8-1]